MPDIAELAQIVHRSYPAEGEEAAPTVQAGLAKVIQHLHWSAKEVARLLEFDVSRPAARR